MAIPMVAAAIGGKVLGGILGGIGQDKVAKESLAALRNAQLANTSMSSDMRNEQTGLAQPYMTAGQNALSDLESFRMNKIGPYQAQTFGGVDMSQDPGMAFRMQQGQQAIDASAANKGNLFSGAHQKALMKYGQDLGSQEFSNAYDRQYGQFSDEETNRQKQFDTERDYIANLDRYRMSQLQDLTGRGQTAAGQLSGQLGQIGSNELKNNLVLTGQQGAVNAQNAALPWQTAGNIVGGASSDLTSYFMNR